VKNANGTAVTLQSTGGGRWRKQVSFSSVLNVRRQSEDVTSVGRLFQIFAAATGNAWSPIVESRVSGILPLPKSTTSAGVVDQVVRWQAVKHQPGRPAQVHGDTGRLVRPVCMIFALAYAANEDAEAAVWCGRIDWTGTRVEPQHSWPPRDDLAGMTVYKPV